MRCSAAVADGKWQQRCGVVLLLQVVNGAVWCITAVADGEWQQQCGVVLLLQVVDGAVWCIAAVADGEWQQRCRRFWCRADRCASHCHLPGAPPAPAHRTRLATGGAADEATAGHTH